MKKCLFILGLISLYFNCLAQSEKFSFKKLSIEPAIGLRLSSAFGLVDVQVSGLVQYHLNKRFSLASHTAFSFDLNSFKAFKNINPKYSFTAFQKVGIGTSVFTKNSEHAMFLMTGAKYFAYSANIKNTALEDQKQTKFQTLAMDNGLLYNLKIGKNSPYFSGRVYVPVFDGKWNAVENAALEFGAGFKLR